MNSQRFVLTSEECEILLAFESFPTLEKLALHLGRDISNISRALNRISHKVPVIEKQGGKWVLTERGGSLNQHTRDSILFQQSLFQQQSLLRIGTNREFSSRILGTHFNELLEIFPNTHIRICAFEFGTEKELLAGSIDISIDCDRPFSPEISYKLAISEPIIAVCSPSFKKKNLKILEQERLLELPHLLCDRLAPDKILKKSDDKLNVLASFNDIATTRSACEQGLGWALLPNYTVKSELQRGSLVEIKNEFKSDSKYGVWRLRSRKFLEPTTIKIQQWLETIRL